LADRWDAALRIHSDGLAFRRQDDTASDADLAGHSERRDADHPGRSALRGELDIVDLEMAHHPDVELRARCLLDVARLAQFP
jgi:hypothetical protein